MRSEAGMARQGKLKRLDGSETNAMAAKTSVKASLPNLPNKRYPSLTLVPQAILEETSALHIRDRNNQHHVLLQRYAVYIIRGILALYSSETISEGLKSKIFLG